ncbi:HAD family hydrolase [Verrucomicrobiota bacterium sgz303538]
MRLIAVFACLVGFAVQVCAQDPLPSWRDTAPKKAIIAFVEKVTKEGSPDFVPVDERLATFDNDGTLWAEQPLYFEFLFAIDRIKALSPEHPEWKEKQPFASLLKGGAEAVAAIGKKGVLEMMAATHTGMTVEEFKKVVTDWIATARHPTTGRLYTEMIYQPMLELLAYLRASGFKTYVVSGGGIEFMRPWTQKTYGIPPDQIVGSYVKLKYELRDGEPVLMKLPEVGLVDDHGGKPEGIQTLIGLQPIAAFGNSDGDQQMLEWTTGAPGLRFALLVHHDDAVREWAYDRDSFVGRLDTAWAEAKVKGWTVVSMRDDWATIFPAPK